MASNKPKFKTVVMVETSDGIVVFKSEKGTIAYTSSTTFDGKATKSVGNLKTNGPFTKLEGAFMKALIDNVKNVFKDIQETTGD